MVALPRQAQRSCHVPTSNDPSEAVLGSLCQVDSRHEERRLSRFAIYEFISIY
jgi:hypothetical protein